MIRISVATTAPELEAIYRFRYRVYVEEMHRPQKDADHASQRIEDALDATAINLAAWQGDELIGVVRNNLGPQGHFGMYEDFYDVRSVGPAHPSHTSITTRLMVAPQLRHTRLPLMLACECYRVGLDNGVHWNFIDCNEHLVGFFTRMGYIQHLPRAWHEEYGHVSCMRLNLLDTAHLAKINSPFLTLLHQRLSRQPTIMNTYALEL